MLLISLLCFYYTSSRVLAVKPKPIQESMTNFQVCDLTLQTTPPTKIERTYYEVPLSKEVQDYIFELAEEYHVDGSLIFAMIETESNFEIGLVSRTNDYGLMQINKCNHKRLQEQLGVVDFLDPKQNILAGTYMISGHLEANNGDYTKALMCYNMGAYGARKAWAKGITSTSYTKKVLAALEKYTKE